MKNKLLLSLALLSSLKFWSQSTETMWVCPGSELTLGCPGDSLDWFVVEENDTLALGEEGFDFVSSDAGLVIPEFPETWLNQVLLSKSTASADSGSVVCSFLIQEFSLQPALILFPDQVAPLCSGDSLQLLLELPDVPDSTIAWSAFGEVTVAGSSLGTFTDSLTVALPAGASIIVAAEATGAQCPIFQLTDSVEVFPSLVAPEVQSSEEYLCLDNDGLLITRLSQASGGDGIFEYSWQQLSAGDWMDIGTADSLQTGPLQPGLHEFRCLAQNACGDVVSDLVLVEVFPALSPPTLNVPTQPLCSPNAGANLSIAESAEGSDSFTYLWQMLLEDTWSAVGEGASIQTNELPTGQHVFRVVAQSDCGEVASAEVEIDVVTPIQGPQASISDTTLCSENLGVLLSLDSSSSGGNEDFEYSWQQLAEGGWTAVSELDTFLTEPLSSGQYVFRLESFSSCGVSFSEELNLEVYAPLSPPEVSFSTTELCSENLGVIGELTVVASGGSNSFVYQWEVLGDSDWQLLSFADSLVSDPLEPGNYTYRLLGVTGCGEVSSNEVPVIVYEPLVAQTASVSDSAVCFPNNGVFLILDSEAEGGDEDFEYIWEQENAGQWEVLSPVESFQTASLDPGQHFFRLRSTNVCGELLTDALEVLVYDPLTPPIGSISNDTLCAVNDGVLLSLSEYATGGDGEFEYGWDELHSGTWEELSTEETFSTGALPSGSYSYRLRATSSCGTSTSVVQEVLAFDTLVAPIIELSSNDTLCSENEGALVNLIGSPSGGAPDNTPFWLISTGAGDTQVSDSTGQWLTDVLSSTSGVQYVNENECGVTESNEVHVTVLNPFVGSEILTNLSSEEGVCHGSDFEVFQWAGAPTGGANQFNVVWTALMGESILQSQSGEGSFTVESLAEEDLQIQLSVVDVLGCGQSLSTLDVQVYAPVVAPVIYSTTSDTLCAENDGVSVFVGVQPSGGVPENLTLWNIEQEGETSQVPFGDLESVLLEELESTLTVWMTNDNLCANTQSDSLTFEVLPEMVAPVIGTSQAVFPLCFGDDSPPLFVNSPPVGATNEWDLQWVQTVQSQEVVVAESLDTFSLPYQTDSSSLVLIAESTFGCGTVMSNEIEIPVLSELMPGVLSSSQLICFNTAPSTLSSTSFSGGSGDVQYQWHFTQENSSSTVNTPGDSFGLGQLIDTMVVVLEVVDLYGCGSVLTNEVVIDVLPDLEEPSIELSNTDTLCWMEAIGLSAVGFEAYPWLDLQWSSSPDLSAQLSGAQSYLAEVSQLDTSTVFSLVVSSSYGCGSLEAMPVEVPVYAELLPGTIGTGEQPEFESSFCFGDTLEEVFNVVYPQGGSTQWQVDWLVFNANGQEVMVETAEDSISPLVLTEPLEIVRRTSDLLGCGTLLSNSIAIAVYDSLAWETNLAGVEMCDSEAFSDFSVLGTGGGGAFEYFWQSSDSLFALSAINGGTLFGLVPNGSMEVWVEATSLNGCGELHSDTAEVFVAAPLTPGDISAMAEEICSEESVLITTETVATGGLGEFVFEWMQEDAAGTPTASGQMSPDILIEGDEINIVGYQLATNACGSVNSDTVVVVVNPLPDVPTLNGILEPCLGSTNQSYSLSSGWWLGLDYEWEIEGGSIISGETGPTLLVDWNAEPGAWGMQVELTYLETGCQSDHDFDINPSEYAAPPATGVLKKLGQDILISADSSDCAVYQWGAIDVETGEELEFEDQNNQYIILNPLDTESYHYFVDVSYSCEGFGDCSTRNFYVHVPFVSIDEIQGKISIFPNPTLGRVGLDGLQNLSSWKLYSFNGALLEEGEIAPGDELDFAHLSSGIYLLRVQGEDVKLQIFK